MLDRKEMECLDKLGIDSLFSTGHKLSYNEVLKALLDFAIEIGVSGENIDSLKTLKERLIKKTGNKQENKQEA
jgi:hypothetical protein